jgi:hypothetical protein
MLASFVGYWGSIVAIYLKKRQASTPWQRLLSRWPYSKQVTRAIILLGTVCIACIGIVLYILGPLNPRSRADTISTLANLSPGVAYHRAAVDHSGWLWIAQSQPGTEANPNDGTLLTLLDPGAPISNPTRGHICLSCGHSAATPRFARIDDIAADPTHAHSIYVAGWTIGSDGTAASGSPQIVSVELPTDPSRCQKDASCATVTTILDTHLLLPRPRDGKIQTAIADMLTLKVQPLMALATDSKGILYCFFSDRGRPSLQDSNTGLLGGYEGMLRYAPNDGGWSYAYLGPSGTFANQRVGPTSTITAMTIDRNNRYIYLADMDRAAIYRADLTDSGLHSPDPYDAATRIHLFAGQLPTQASPGSDLLQAIPGWQGDGHVATQARLGIIRSLAMDDRGDLFVSDASNGRVRIITPDGKIATVAGNTRAATTSDETTPLDLNLNGLTAIASDGKGRLFAIANNSVHVLQWGWSSAANTTANRKDGAQIPLSSVLTGLPLSGQQQIITSVISSSNCLGSNAHGPCNTAYIVAAGGWGGSQLALAAPGALPAGATTLENTLGNLVIGTDTHIPTTLVANHDTPTIDVTLPYPGCCTGGTPTDPFALPAGVHATGIALLIPTNNTQATTLGGSLILVAAQNDGANAEVLIYRAATDTCGLDTNAPANCARFPGIPSLIATVPLGTAKSAGGITTALSNDATHAFALVTNPSDNKVSALDLTAFIKQGTLPSVTQVQIQSPTTLALRHDNLAAYIGNADGDLAILPLADWLTQGIPPNVAIKTMQHLDSASLVSMAVAADDSHLFAALRSANETSTLITLAVGTGGAPTEPQVTHTTRTDKHIIAVALTPGDERLLTLADPGHPSANGVLRAWATHDPAQPDHWLDTPLDLGDTSTPPNPEGFGTFWTIIGR